MVAGMLLAPAGDVAAKILSSSLPAVEIAWLRTLLQAAILFPFICVFCRGWPRRFAANIRPLMLMGSLWALSTVGFFYAIVKNPIPNALALFFVCPIAVMSLAPSFLGERFRIHRFLGVLVSFLGVLFVLRPGGDYHPSIFASLGAGVCYGCYLMSHRKLIGRSGPLERSFFAGVTALLLPLPFVLWAWEWPGPETAVPLVMLGVATCGSHWLIALASEHADASVYAPFNYVEIVSATALSWVFFRTFPDLWAWVGIAIIIGSGLYLMWRERRDAIADRIAPI